MANLNTKTLAAGVGDILCVDGGISGDKQIKDGDGTASNLYIDGTNLGIGKTAPTNPLHIYTSENTAILVENTDANCGIYLKDNSTSSFNGILTVANDFTIRTSDAERFRVKSDGKVGIGTDAPDNKLTVNGGAKFGSASATAGFEDHVIVLADGGTAYEGGLLLTNSDDASSGNSSVKFATIGGATSGTADLIIGVVDNNAANTFIRKFMYMDGPTANIGIGTDNPTSKLHVVGTFFHAGNPIIERTGKTISGGVLNVASTEGPYISVAAESGSTDDLDFIQIDGGTRPAGKMLYLTRACSDVITLKMSGGSSADGVTAMKCLWADDVSEAEQTATEVIMGSGFSTVQLLYCEADRWVVVNPGTCRVNV